MDDKQRINITLSHEAKEILERLSEKLVGSSNISLAIELLARQSKQRGKIELIIGDDDE